MYQVHVIRHKADTDGGNVTVLFSTGDGRARGVQLDPSDCVPCGSIQRRNLDGSGREFLVTDLSSPEALGLDPSRNRICWIDLYDATIVCARLDGSAVEILVSDTVALGVAIDPADGRLYWTDRAGLRVRRVFPDGTGAEDLVVGLADPRGIAIDAEARKLYFADRSEGTIQRSDLDGSNREILVSDPAPTSITLDTTFGGAEPVPSVSEWGMIVIALLLLTLGTAALCGLRTTPSSTRGRP